MIKIYSLYNSQTAVPIYKHRDAKTENKNKFNISMN